MMKSLILIFKTVIVFLISSVSFISFSAAEKQTSQIRSLCEANPKMAVKYVDQLVRTLYKLRKVDPDSSLQFPDLIPLQRNDYVGSFSFDKRKNESANKVSYQAILRPKLILRKNKDGTPDKNIWGNLVWDVPTLRFLNLVMFKLDRSRHLMYVCGNYDSKHPENLKLTIYFIVAYGLVDREVELTGDISKDEKLLPEFDYTSGDFSVNRHKKEADDNSDTIFGDWLFGPGKIFGSKNSSVASIGRIPVEFLPFSTLTGGVVDIIEWLPGLDVLLKVPASGIKLTGRLASKVISDLGAGVQRIELTNNKLEFASDVDLDNPSKATIIYTLPLKDKITPNSGNH